MLSHTLIGRLAVELDPRWTVDGYYAFVVDEDFSRSPAVPGTGSRDGQRHTIGVRGTHLFEDGYTSVSLGYKFIRNDADGSNYNSTGHALALGLQAPLTSRIWLLANAAVIYEDYDDGFVTGAAAFPAREDTVIYDFRTVFLYAFDEHMTFDVTLGYAIWNSNHPLWDADRFYAQLGVSYQF